MTAVPVQAIRIAFEKAATRPVPVAGSFSPTSGETRWSDGIVARGDQVPRPVETSSILLCRVVRWSDGSVSFRLPSSRVEQTILILRLLSRRTSWRGPNQLRCFLKNSIVRVQASSAASLS
jgi:hypothetical protein